MLLRHNVESGPYTIDELLQQKITPADLIWEIDTSYAWQYPAEVRSLKPHLDATVFPGLSPRANHAPRHLRNRHIPDEIEIKAEKLRKRIQEQATQNHNKQNRVGRAVSEYSSGEPAAVLSDFHFVHHKPAKFDWYPVAVTVVACVFAGGFLFAARNMFAGKHDPLNGQAAQIIHTDQHAAIAATPAPVIASVPPMPDSNAVVKDSAAQLIVATPKPAVRRVVSNVAAAPDTETIAQPATIDPQPVQQEVSKPKPVVDNPPVQTVVETESKPVKKQEAVVVKEDPQPETASPDTEEKKGFLKGLFKKKDRD